MAVPSIEELIGSSSQRLTPFRDYRMIRGGGESAYLSLFAPPQGQVLVTAATRVNHFEGLTDTLPDLGLPSRMKDCLVYYACWQLLSQRLPLNQEGLVLTQRQTESGSEDRSEVLAGAQTQTQTDNKAEDSTSTVTDDKTTQVTNTQTDDKTQSTAETVTDDKSQSEVGTKDATIVEQRAGSISEVVDLEETATKDESVTTTGGEITTDVRTAATTGTTAENFAETTVGDSRTTELTTDVRTPMLLNIESGSEKTDIPKKVTIVDVNPHTENQVTERHDAITESMTWDEANPPKQKTQTTPGYDITTSTRHTEDKHDWTTTTDGAAGTDVHQEQHFGKIVAEQGVDRTQKTVTTDVDHDEQHESNTNTSKTESTSEDSQGTVTKDQTDSTTGNDLTVSAQEKTTTDDGSTTTTTDEDSTSTILNTGTTATATTVDNTGTTALDELTTNGGTSATVGSVTNTGTSTLAQDTDNTTTTTTGSDKVTGVESMSTYRDRLQTAQYYKLLLDMEVQSKKMRSWVARGL